MADKILNARIQNAVYTEAQWRAENPVLKKGELAFSSDKEYIYKVGDGTSTWSALSYAPLMIKDLSIDGKTITYTKTDGTTGTLTTQDTNTTYSVMIGASSSADGKSGLVPQPTKGNQGKFLRGDGTWATPTDTKNTAGSTNSSSKLFLIGATTQGANPQTYSNANVYISSTTDSEGKTYYNLYSNGIQVVNLSDAQALTNKTYNGYTLAAACAKGVTDSTSAGAISTGTNLVTERDVYYGLPTINGSHSYTSGTNIYAPTTAGTSDYILKSSGSGAPTWIAQSSITAGKANTWTTERNFTIKDHDSSHSGTAVAVNGSKAITLLLPSTIKATLSGNASTATSAGKWTTARNFTIKDHDSTNAGTAVSVDGSGAITLLLPSTIKATLSGNASTATQVYGTLTNPTDTNGTTYTIPFHTDVSSSNKTLRNNDGLRYQVFQGTTSAVGWGTLILGNTTASGTAGNKQGYLKLYSSNSGYGQITQASTTSAINHILPATGGTILNTGTTSASRSYSTGLSIGSVTINSSATTLFVPYAGSNQAGAISTGTQTFSGAKTFSGAITLSSTLSVTGTSTFTGAATFNGGITGTLTGNASSATKVYGTLRNPSTSTTYYIPFHTNASSGNKSLLNNDGFRHITLEGTTSADGYNILSLGNSTASATAGNKYGRIDIYSTNAGCGRLRQAPVSSSISHTLPTTGGTILNTGTSSKAATYTSGLSIGTVKMNGNTSTYYVPHASASQVGVVNTGTQTFAGAKTFNNGISIGGTSNITWHDTGNWAASNSGVTFPVVCGGLYWSGQSDWVKLFAEETAFDTLNLVLQFGDDNNNGLSIRNNAGTQTAHISANGVFTGSFSGNLTGTADYAKALKVKGSDSITSTANDTTANWGAYDTSVHWYTTAGQLTDQPSQWGYLLNIGKYSEVHQLWMTQPSGNMLHRGGNGLGWSGTWRTILDSINYSTYALPLSGGTVTGGISIGNGLYVSGGTTINSALVVNGGLELSHATPAIDFHFNKSSADYTSRIIEASSGILTVQAALVVDKTGTNNPLTVKSNIVESSIKYSSTVASYFWAAGPGAGQNTFDRFGFYNGSGGSIAYMDKTGNMVLVGNLTAAKGVFHGNYNATPANRYANSALEIRENGHVGTAQTDIGYAPSIGFHWSGRCAGTLVLDSSGQFQFVNQAGGNAPLYASNITATGNLTTWGGATISGNATCGGVITSAISSSGGGYINLTDTGAIGFNGRATVPPTGKAGIRPSVSSSLATNGYSCGHSSYYWSVVYAVTTQISTSDRNKKKDFKTFDSNDNYEKLFFDLKPCVFKFMNGTSNRDHFGFISQDVEESLYKFGFDDKSFAGFCKDVLVDEDEKPILDEKGNLQYNYALRYDEFISLNTYMIQKSYSEIDAVRAENENLKARIEKLEKIIEGLCA